MWSYSSADAEYDSDEPLGLQLNFDKLKERAAEVFGSKCISVKRLTRGPWHEVYVLYFDAKDSTAP